MWFLVLCIFARLFWRARETLVKQPPGSVSLGNWKENSFCLFIVVLQSLWQRVGWELPGYFRLIFHIRITRFNNSVTHEISVRFILCETIIACFLLGRLFNSLTAGIILVGQFWYYMQCLVNSPNSNLYIMAKLYVTLHTQYPGW